MLHSSFRWLAIGKWPSNSVLEILKLPIHLEDFIAIAEGNDIETKGISKEAILHIRPWNGIMVIRLTT